MTTMRLYLLAILVVCNTLACAEVQNLPVRMLDKPSDADVSSLTAAAIEDLSFSWSTHSSAPRFIMGRISTKLDQSTIDTTPLLAATLFVDEHRVALGLANIESDFILSTKRVEGNKTHVRLQQRIDDIEVYGGELGVHFDGTDVYAIHGTLAISIGIDLVPRISESKALQAALRVSGATRTFTPTRLVVLSPNVDPSLKKTYLAWLFEVANDAAGSAYQVLIDASNGRIIRSRSLDQSTTKNVADYQNGNSSVMLDAEIEDKLV